MHHIQRFFILVLISTLFLGNQPSVNYNDYYNLVNNAELYIIQHKFMDAFRIYKSIYFTYKNRDLKDIFNSYICAIKVKEYDFAKLFFEDLIKSGYSFDTLGNKTFNYLPVKIVQKLTKEKDSLEVEYKSKFDFTTKSVLDSLDEQEQYWLKNKLSGYDSLVLEHAKTLYRIIVERGIPEVPMFPGTMKIPIGLLRHHFYAYNKFMSLKKQNSTINFQAYESYFLKPLLIKAISNGMFSPQLYNSSSEYNLMDETKLTGKVLIEVDLENKTINFKYPGKDKLDHINKNRKEVCLEPFEDAVKKIPNLQKLQQNYPFKEHITLCKRLGLSKLTANNATMNVLAEFPAESLEIQNKIMNEPDLKLFSLAHASYSFSVILPDK